MHGQLPSAAESSLSSLALDYAFNKQDGSFNVQLAVAGAAAVGMEQQLQ